MKKRLEDIKIEIIDGDRGKNYPNGEDFHKEKYCIFLNAKNVTNNGFDFSELTFINKEKDEQLNRGKVDRNDVIMTTRGTVGNLAYYSEDVKFENIRINSGMVILRAKSENINSKYLYYALKSNDVKNQINHLKTGSAQPQLPITILKNIEINLPTIEYQKRIVKIIESLDKKIKLNNQINDNLAYVA